MRNKGGRKRIELPKGELERMYWTENMQPSDIARRFNVSSGTVYNRLHDYGIPVKDNLSGLHVIEECNKKI